MAETMREALERLQRGEIGFSCFLRATRDDWKRLAMKLMRPWRRRLPDWLSIEDIEQEVLGGAYEAFIRYDSTRGVALSTFMIWTACTRAKKRMHKARGVKLHRTPWKHASCFEVPVTRYWNLPAKDGQQEPRIEGLMAMAGAVATPQQELQLQRRACLVEALLYCEDMSEALAVEALEGADDLDVAAERLYEDELARVACGVVDQRSSRKHVAKVARKVAARMGIVDLPAEAFEVEGEDGPKALLVPGDEAAA